MMLAECLAPYLMSSINDIILFNINTSKALRCVFISVWSLFLSTAKPPAPFLTSATSTTLESFRLNTEILADFSKRNFRICAYPSEWHKNKHSSIPDHEEAINNMSGTEGEHPERVQ